MARGLRTRFTFDVADEMMAVWSPDGSRVVFNSRRKGNLDLYLKEATGAGAEQPLLSDNRINLYPADWSADGRHLLVLHGKCQCRDRQRHLDFAARRDGGRRLAEGRKPMAVLKTEFNETFSRFSPDGRWVTYQSNEVPDAWKLSCRRFRTGGKCGESPPPAAPGPVGGATAKKYFSCPRTIP